MSDSQEKSDDLIAELAKLMASNAGGDPPPRPGVIKLPPLGEATVKTSPVRIPGMDAPRSAASANSPAESPRSAPPAAHDAQPAAPGATPASAGGQSPTRQQGASQPPPVRIPGMSGSPAPSAAPAPSTAPAPSAAPPATAAPPPPPKPVSQFDFGRPPAPPSISVGQPLNAATGSLTSRAPLRLPPQPPAKPDSVANLAGLKFDAKPGTSAAAAPPPAGSPAGARVEPRLDVPHVATRPQASQPPAADARGERSDDHGDAPHHEAKGREPGGHASADADDPIAALINAELDSKQNAPAPRAAAAPAGDEAPVQVHAAQPMPPGAPRPRTEPSPHSASASQSVQTVRPVSARRPESDRFAVLPASEAAEQSAPAPMQPDHMTSDSDTLDEIESLIGEAVRVELAGSEGDGESRSRPSQPPPVVPPLGRAAPRRANMREATASSSAEAAILAAAATTGAKVERVENVRADGERPVKRARVKPPQTGGAWRGMRPYVGIALSAVLLLAAGFGLYWVLGMGSRDDPGNAPILTADATPTKVEPTVVETEEPAASVVFNEINGEAAADTTETLVSRDETAGESPADVVRVVSPPDDDSNDSGLANRKVRTVTVRPDGTIVASDASIAGSEALPVQRPNVPEIAGAEVEPSDLLTAAVAEGRVDGAAIESPALDPIAALVAETDSTSAAPLVTPLELEAGSATTETSEAATEGTPTEGTATEGTATEATTTTTGPFPAPRPSTRLASLGDFEVVAAPAPTTSGTVARTGLTPLTAVTQTPEAPVLATEAAPATTAAASGAYVQLSSQPSESAAQASLRTLGTRLGNRVGGGSLEVRRVDLGGRGIWYRVVLPVRTFQDATQTCASFKANGIDCVPING